MAEANNPRGLVMVWSAVTSGIGSDDKFFHNVTSGSYNFNEEELAAFQRAVFEALDKLGSEGPGRGKP